MDVLHVRSIARLYGENGYEIVDLLGQSPATAVRPCSRSLLSSICRVSFLVFACR